MREPDETCPPGILVAVEFVRSLRQLWRHRLFRRLARGPGGDPDRGRRAAGRAGLVRAVLPPAPTRRRLGSHRAGHHLVAVLDPGTVRGGRPGPLVPPPDPGRTRSVSCGAWRSRWRRWWRPGCVPAATELIFYGGVLLTMSLNRFLLAALSAALPHTIEPGEYMVANSVMPTIGPAGTVIGVGLGTGLRLVLGAQMPDYAANGILFAVAAGGFVFSASLALRIGRRQLGPDQPEPARPGDIVAGLVEALRHLRERREAGLGLLAIGAHRIVYGVVTVAMILVFRNYLHAPDEVAPALADLGLLAIITAAGFVAAAAVTPPASARVGVRTVIVACFVLSAGFQIVPGRDLRQGAAARRRLPPRGHRAEHQALRRHPRTGPRRRRAQGPRLRAVRHGLQRRAGHRRRDRRRHPARRRPLRVDLGRAGRRAICCSG